MKTKTMTSLIKTTEIKLKFTANIKTKKLIIL